MAEHNVLETDDDIIEAVMCCLADKEYTTFKEVASLLNITTSQLRQRMASFQDILREGRSGGLIKLRLPKDWP